MNLNRPPAVAVGSVTSPVNVGDAIELKLQQAYALGDLPEVSATIGNDLLFATSGNRFAIMNLIRTAFSEPGQVGAIYRASDTAKLTLGSDAVKTLQEIIDVLGRQNARAAKRKDARSVINIPKTLVRATTMPPQKMFNWLKNSRNRNAFLRYATMAAVAEDANRKFDDE